MECDFPRCECMCHPDSCVFKEENRKKGRIMNDQVVQETVQAFEQERDTENLLAARGSNVASVVDGDGGQPSVDAEPEAEAATEVQAQG